MEPSLQKGMATSLTPVVNLTDVENVIRRRSRIDHPPPLQDPGLPNGVELSTKLLERGDARTKDECLLPAVGGINCIADDLLELRMFA